MDDTDTDALEALAGTVKSYLRWAVFLLIAMGAVLIIDLQIKRSITRQAEAASKLIGQRVFQAESGAGHGRATPDVAATTHDGGQPPGGGGDAMDGVPGVAAGTDPGDRPKQAGRGGVAKRPPRNEP